MAGIQEIERIQRRKIIKKGDVVTCATRGRDGLFLVIDDNNTIYFEVVSLSTGDKYNHPRKDIDLFEGSFKMYNVL